MNPRSLRILILVLAGLHGVALLLPALRHF